jgi:hypothetical protein
MLAAACGGGERRQELSNNVTADVELEGAGSARDYADAARIDGNFATGTGNTVGPDPGNATDIAPTDVSLANTVAPDPGYVPVVARVPAPLSFPEVDRAIPRKPGPLVAPNGFEWPSAAGYLRGYELLRSGGLSSVTVDNGANDSKMFVKLVAVDAAGATAVRHLFIPAYGSFTMAGISAGTYDVRYMNLWDGTMVGTEPFTLSQTHVTMTLYKVPNGNMRTHALTRDQF